MERFFGTNHRLLHMDFSGCNLSPFVDQLVRPFSRCPALVALHLSDNQLTESQKNAFLTAFKIKTTITELLNTPPVGKERRIEKIDALKVSGLSSNG